MKCCQSCGMPENSTHFNAGTEKDGSANADYCSYCYNDGQFTHDCTMDEMVEICVGEMKKFNPDTNEEAARQMMNEFFPSLKRWS